MHLVVACDVKLLCMAKFPEIITVFLQRSPVWHTRGFYKRSTFETGFLSMFFITDLNTIQKRNFRNTHCVRSKRTFKFFLN